MSGEKNKGFTLVEMVIVLSIFAILLGILIPSLNSLVDYRATRAAKSITTGFERLRTEAATRLVAEMKLEKKSDGYYISYYLYKGKNGTKYNLSWTDKEKIAPARTKIEYKLGDLYKKDEIDGKNYQELKEGESLLFTIDRSKGGFRALQEKEVTKTEIENLLSTDESNRDKGKNLTYHDIKSNDGMEATCYYIRVSGRVKKRMIKLEQSTGKVTMTITM